MKDLQIPEEMVHYHRKDPTWFISRVPQSGNARSVPSRYAQVYPKSSVSQALPRTVTSGITVMPTMQHQQMPTSSFRQEAMPNPTFIGSGIGSATFDRYSRAPVQPHSHSHVWGQRATYSHFATISGRSHRDGGQRVTAEPLSSLTIVARPILIEDMDRHGSGHESPFPLRTTSRSTYRLVPVTNTHSPTRQFSTRSVPLTTSIASTTAHFSPMATERLPEQAATNITTSRDLRVEEPEASESQLYARGKFARTPEETEINDNSCISFAY